MNKVIVQLAHENADLVCQKIFKYNLFNVINKNDYCRLPSLGEMEMGGLFSQISKKLRTKDSLNLNHIFRVGNVTSVTVNCKRRAGLSEGGLR